MCSGFRLILQYDNEPIGEKDILKRRIVKKTEEPRPIHIDLHLKGNNFEQYETLVEISAIV